MRSWKLNALALLAFAAASVVRAVTDGALVQPNWPFTTMSTVIDGNILSSPAVAPDGTVYIGVEVGASTATNPGGQLFALSPTGTKKWVFPTSDWIDSTPAIARDGTIYFGCWDGNLYALNPDGSQKWKFSLGAFVSASPAIGPDGTIYIGAGNGNFCAVNPDGTMKWLFPTLYWIEAAPAIAPDGTIYIGSDDNNFYAIRPDGTEKWHYTVGNDIASSAAIAADGTVYVGSRDLNFYAFNPDGTVKWTYQTTDMIDASPVLAADGTIYVASTAGRVFALNPDGTEKWRYPAATQSALSSLYSTPAVRSDGTIVFGTSDDYVCALNPNGTLLWKATVGDWADSSPLVTPDGVIYIGCTDKNVYAFSSTATSMMTDWPQLLRDPQRNGVQVMGAIAGTSGRLSNLSVRTFAGSGDSTLQVGLNAGGTGVRNLLVRGVGPTLSVFNVTGYLPDPRITFYSGQTVVASNDNWQDNANWSTIQSVGDTVGAFPLPPGSLDAAMLSSIAPGAQKVLVSGRDGTTGLALMEVYDTGGDSSARLINLSARSFADTGAGALFAGFVVANSTRTILVRGIGPTLTQFQVTGVLVDPVLRIYNSDQKVVAENDNWSTSSNPTLVSNTSDAVGAFPLTSGSADSVLLLTLPPGNYSAAVSGKGNTTGNTMVEIYEVP